VNDEGCSLFFKRLTLVTVALKHGGHGKHDVGIEIKINSKI